MKRMSSNPEDWATPTPPPPPIWLMDDRGYIGLRDADTLHEMGRANRQLQRESPLFVQTVAEHNRAIQYRAKVDRFKQHMKDVDLRRATR